LESETELKLTSDAPLPGASESATALKPENALCPVSGAPVNPKYTIVYEGRVIGFCCPNCPKSFWQDPAAFLAKLQP
jgi:YHS domain-containing protein